MRNKKFLLLLSLLVATMGFASTIPTYSITSIDNNLITFSNGSIFEVPSSTTVFLEGWQSGQNAELQANNGPLAPVRSSILDGVLHTNPAFFLRNASQTLFGVSATMIVNATSAGVGTYEIISVDFNTYTIDLGAGGLWSFYASSTPDVVNWQVGDLVMIGQETMPLENYDAILFNTRRQIEIPALEQ